MRIGELSRRSGIPVETIRYYERLQLLRQPARTASGYRDYTASALERLRFIEMTQGLGFALKEVRELLKLHAAMVTVPVTVFMHSAELKSMIQMAETKRAQIEGKIDSLRELSLQLAAFIASLQRTPEPVCPGSQPVSPELTAQRPARAGRKPVCPEPPGTRSRR